MSKAKTYKKRTGPDDLERFATGIFLRLTANQVGELERLAELAGKSLKQYLRDIAEGVIEQMIPAKKT